MSDFNVTKLENGDFEVTKTHQTKANLLYVVWVFFVALILLMSMSCSTHKPKPHKFRSISCKNQMY